jgi:hypothetical protein
MPSRAKDNLPCKYVKRRRGRHATELTENIPYLRIPVEVSTFQFFETDSWFLTSADDERTTEINITLQLLSV